MPMITEKDLPVLEQNLNRIITLITDYGCVNSPDMSRLKLIQKNIKIFQECNEGFDELIKYITEDWDASMRSQKWIIDCYIPSDDIDFKEKSNKELEACFKVLDRLFDTYWIRSRTWYTKQELIGIGRRTGIIVSEWNSNYSFVVKKNEKLKSQVAGISDEAWTYAKCLCVASTDEDLIKWFHNDIPAFGYISLADMSKLENGENIVRHFLTSIPLAFP